MRLLQDHGEKVGYSFGRCRVIWPNHGDKVGSRPRGPDGSAAIAEITDLQPHLHGGTSVMEVAKHALEGLRIVEFSDEIASYCGRLLADLGAEVIKVEPPGGGRQRHLPPFYRDQESPDTSIAFWVHNTSKKSVVLDLETPTDRALAQALALTADIVLEDNPVGWMASQGLGYQELHSLKPSLVYTSVTGFGQTGPHASYVFSDIVGQAMSGIMTLSGEPSESPVQIYGSQANVSASIQAAQGALLAVLVAETTGTGQLVDVSVQESLSISQETAMQTWDLQKTNRTRTGLRALIPVDLPATGVYETLDGHVMGYVLASAGEGFPGLFRWMREEGKIGDLDEPPYAEICSELSMAWITRLMADPASAAAKLSRIQHISDVVAGFFRTMTSAECYQTGQERRLLIGIVSSPRTLAYDKQLRARDWFTRFEEEFLGSVIEFPGAPYRLSGTPALIRRPPRLGEHDDEILSSLTVSERDTR